MTITDNEYWERRKDLNYYRTLRQWVDEFGPGYCIVDVGSRGTPVASWGTFEKRYAVDLEELPQTAGGIEFVRSDWMTWEPPVRVDLITCCQVMEHLTDEVVGPFGRKIIASCRRAIVSVPYMWKKGGTKEHLQDPVSREKLEGWMGRKAIRTHIDVDKGYRRLIAEFRGAREEPQSQT